MMSRSLIADLLAGCHVGTKVTQVLVTSRATHTTTTRWDETKYDMIAGCKPTHICADLLHNSSTFVAADNWKFKWQVASNKMLVRVTKTRRGQLDQHFVRARRIQFNILDAPRSIQFPQHCCFCLHDVPLVYGSDDHTSYADASPRGAI